MKEKFNGEKKTKKEILSLAVFPLKTIFLLFCVDAYALFIFFQKFELDFSLYEREERIVRADAYVYARMDVRTPLADENISGESVLTVSEFYAETFCFGIAAVLGRTDAFFMCKKLQA